MYECLYVRAYVHMYVCIWIHPHTRVRAPTNTQMPIVNADTADFCICSSW